MKKSALDLTLDSVVEHTAAGDALVLEALPRRYFDQGHLPGAHQVDLGEVAASARRHEAERDTPIIVYCAGPTCKNSHQAAAELIEGGFTSVYVFSGGKEEWTASGRALEVDDAH